MKATLKGRVLSFERVEGNVLMTFQSEGKVDKMGAFGKETSLKGVLTLKSSIADEMKMGSVLTISISDEGLADQID